MSQLVKTCLFCLKHITDRSYRSLSSSTSREQYKEVYKLLSLSEVNGFVCNLCVNKLNRISKLNEDLKTKYQIIKQERDKLFFVVKDLPGIKCSTATVTTPSPRGFKRPYGTIKQTPTPKSMKSKKCLFVSPRPSQKSHQAMEMEQHSDVSSISTDVHVQHINDKSTQTEVTHGAKVDKTTRTKVTEQFDVKVCIIFTMINECTRQISVH